MRTQLLLFGMLAAMTPSAALAQQHDPNCVASNPGGRIEGTVRGAVGGALIGGATGHGEGLVVGGSAGAAAVGSRGPCQPGYGPPPPPPPEATHFWDGAPIDIRQRIDWMQSRVERAVADGRMGPEQTRWAYDEIRNIRASTHQLWVRDGSLTAPDAAYIQARLNTLGGELHWMSRAN